MMRSTEVMADRGSEADDAKYEAVTLEQIKAVAQKYLKPESIVIAIIRPEK